MVIREARARGIQHVVADAWHVRPHNLSVAQATEFGRLGGYIEFVYGGTLEKGSTLTVEKYAEWIKAVGPEHCILSTDLGGARPYPRPMPTAGMLEFMERLHKLGISVADINLMAKTNPATVLGLEAIAMAWQEVLLRLGAAAAIGAIIGLDREIRPQVRRFPHHRHCPSVRRGAGHAGYQRHRSRRRVPGDTRGALGRHRFFWARASLSIHTKGKPASKA